MMVEKMVIGENIEAIDSFFFVTDRKRTSQPQNHENQIQRTKTQNKIMQFKYAIFLHKMCLYSTVQKVKVYIFLKSDGREVVS